jgi:glycopeptide antibiotics resistance protein
LGHPATIGPVWALTATAAYPMIIAALRRHGEISRQRRVAVSIFVLYAVCVIAVTIFPIRVRMLSWQHAPWWAVVHYVPFQVPPISFVLNVRMFLPFGVLLPLLWPRTGTVRRMFLLSLAASATIELTQLIMWLILGNYRTVDINDLIANTGGGLLGLLVLRLVARRRARDYDDFQARM